MAITIFKLRYQCKSISKEREKKGKGKATTTTMTVDTKDSATPLDVSTGTDVPTVTGTAVTADATAAGDIAEKGEAPTPGNVVVQGDEYVQHGGPEKKSHNCCGCCCDTRRAVIVVNIISLSFGALAVLSLLMVTSDKYAQQFDDDETQTALNEIDGAAVGMTIGFALIGIICNGAGLFGAIKFNKWGIIIAGLWYVAECIRSLVFFDVIGAIVAGFFAYPHAYFYIEMNEGVMTRMRYPNEQRCCDCCT